MDDEVSSVEGENSSYNLSCSNNEEVIPRDYASGTLSSRNVHSVPSKAQDNSTSASSVGSGEMERKLVKGSSPTKLSLFIDPPKHIEKITKVPESLPSLLHGNLANGKREPTESSLYEEICLEAKSAEKTEEITILSDFLSTSSESSSLEDEKDQELEESIKKDMKSAEKSEEITILSDFLSTLSESSILKDEKDHELEESIRKDMKSVGTTEEITILLDFLSTTSSSSSLEDQKDQKLEESIGKYMTSAEKTEEITILSDFLLTTSESSSLQDEKDQELEESIRKEETDNTKEPANDDVKPPPLAGANVMNVILVAAECAPWSKTGGLGDVAGALSKALALRGHRVMVVAPRYGHYAEPQDTGVLKRYRVDGQDIEVCYFQAYIDGVDFVFIESSLFRGINNNIYGGSRQDILKRMVLFCKAAVEMTDVTSSYPQLTTVTANQEDTRTHQTDCTSVTFHTSAILAIKVLKLLYLVLSGLVTVPLPLVRSNASLSFDLHVTS
ncbi:hypothetical protein Nepgr_017506 [Nepenthes gracilis]|uniref:Starch synthase catalytic domain-containing protein n=1 Tax=Nepenthes gracilis TaxID=150966 RepID=A0AAD3SPI0_NEPGR|nr:hypothetical protein Nepgr_017506 [Nepenthes gracilis]